MSVRKNFTLIELLIVVAIIGILVSILMPSLAKARQAAKYAVCKAGLSQHYRVLLVASKNNNTRIPRINNFGSSKNPDTDLNLMDHDWYGSQKSTYSMVNPTMGLFTKNYDFLRCPSLNEGVQRSGIGSNHSFDYTVTAAFSIAFIDTINNSSRWGSSYAYGNDVPTPIIMEEEAEGGINGINFDTGFCASDRLAINHMGSKKMGSYAAIDGSVHAYVNPLADQLRTFSSFYSLVKSNRYSVLKAPTDPKQGADSGAVWHRRLGYLVR